MNAADVLWKLIAAGVMPAELVERACEVLDVDKRDLKAARARYECPAPVPAVVPDDTRHGSGPSPRAVGTASPRGARPPAPPQGSSARRYTYTAAGRERIAERAFISLRVAQFKCDLCGELVESGDVVVVDRAHHETCEHRAKVD